MLPLTKNVQLKFVHFGATGSNNAKKRLISARVYKMSLFTDWGKHYKNVSPAPVNHNTGPLALVLL